MLKMNTWAWIAIGGGIAGLLIGVISVLMVGGSEGPLFAAGMLIMFGGIGFMLYKFLFGPMINASRLQKVGLPGRAKILEVRDTGVTINNSPQVKLILEVKDNLGQTYTTHCRVLVSRINPGMYTPGMEVPVKIDPKNEKNVIIDFTGSNTTAFSQQGGNVAALKAELEQLQQQQEAIMLSGRSARAIIKNYKWLGAYVNGKNPYVELDLEVLPENSVSFSSKAKGVISEIAVEKYQPGKEIYVKYDLYDNSKVVIEHS
jgi:hypothetical protein